MTRRGSSELILIRGLPGSGKSTMARKLNGHKHFEADMYFEKNGAYVFEAEKLQCAHDWCYEGVSKALRAEHKVVVSNTFVQLWELNPYVRLASSLGVSYQVVHAVGSWKSIHNVPVGTLDRMPTRWEVLE
ncbi:ATP-binding protein [Pseudomonadales bacterium]|nr:ATP-binding protein [Pseudomonadales bacterium]